MCGLHQANTSVQWSWRWQGWQNASCGKSPSPQLGLPRLGSSQGVTPGPPAPFFQEDGDLIWGYPQPQGSQGSAYETGARRLGAVGREQHWQSRWLVRPSVLGTLQDVILDVAHSVHLVARCHPPVEAAPAEVILAWARRGAEGMEGQQEFGQRPIPVAAQAAQAHGTLHLAGALPQAPCASPQTPTRADGMPCLGPFPTHPSIPGQEPEQCHERLR